MKILFVVSGTRRVAASRYRVYQYLPAFERLGVDCRVMSSISDRATDLSIRSPEFKTAMRLAYYGLLFFERFFRFWLIFFGAFFADIIFLQRATFPFGLARLLRLTRKKIVFDIDDAIYLPDTQDQSALTAYKAFIKEREIRDILGVSDCIIVENNYIKGYVKRYCSNVHKIPGPIDTERYCPLPPEARKGQDCVVIGWIGSPATTGYLHLLDNVFGELVRRVANVRIVLIGAGSYNVLEGIIVKKPWRYETEVADLQEFDIGLMPMPDNEWTKGKLGCKMLQYMALGIPPVVSYTPTNAELIQDRVNGFLISKAEEWVDVLSMLIRDVSLRHTIGDAGRRSVEDSCSVRNNAPRLVNILRSLV
ncbi:MAG: glycosyltransferase family 4 protein [Candidatus Omnitrophica bacterium]|nr:glycosyltransferase family 4 protein [Candidatus Omnitrophota bacterium]